ncbi:mandelate racemase [Streptomyces sp. MUSC 14]|uniref:enolase C-terminal domain-like protein n=1 Tax=Streptomyces sp. MUSC 14 TaxID=1354889 RepID=UPI0008F55BB5|nr:enolase C-terminal domain-like protein [Streptomyces sp. MUSC 14]OIK00821.1 mandelate racemase [Streptomyces sp. MUSC 14]
MKLRRPEVSVYTVPTDAPEADGTLAWASTTMVIAEASAGDVTGTGWTYGPAAVGLMLGEHLAPLVEGHDPLDIPALHDAMCRSVRDAGRPGVTACAISALDIALWDLKARLLGLPLVSLLGAARTHVPVYGSGGFTTYDDRRLAEQLGDWVHARHIPRVKIRIGEDWGRAPRWDLARVRTARRTVGPEAELYVDAGGAYTRKQALRVGDGLAEYGVTWFEEPVSADDLTGLRLLRDTLPCEVTAGEYGYDLPYFARLITAHAVDCLQVDATRCGGITEFLRAAALAQAHGLEVSAHRAPHVHAAAAASIPNFRHLEWFHDHVRIESMFFAGALDPAGGTVRPEQGHGLGLTLRRDTAEKYRVA